MGLNRIAGLVGLSSATVAMIAMFASPARADDNFDLSVSKGQITVKAKPGWHINQDYGWAVKKGSDKLKVKDDFKLDKETATVSGIPSGTVTIKGAVCSESACAPFTKENVSVP